MTASRAYDTPQVGPTQAEVGRVPRDRTREQHRTRTRAPRHCVRRRLKRQQTHERTTQATAASTVRDMVASHARAADASTDTAKVGQASAGAWAGDAGRGGLDHG